jgi:hypothetical protein
VGGRGLWLGIAAVAGFGALLAAAPPEPATPPVSLELPEGALVAPGPAADLTLLFTGDVIGYIEPCG